MYLQIGTQTKPVLTLSFFYRSRACLGSAEVFAEAVRRRGGHRSRRKQRWSRGHAGQRGREFMKGNIVASKTTASDRKARGGGVIDTLAEANGSVLAAQWGEAAEEHGGDVVGVWAE